jgi:hypothetical protein
MLNVEIVSGLVERPVAVRGKLGSPEHIERALAIAIFQVWLPFGLSTFRMEK